MIDWMSYVEENYNCEEHGYQRILPVLVYLIDRISNILLLIVEIGYNSCESGTGTEYDTK